MKKKIIHRSIFPFTNLALTLIRFFERSSMAVVVGGYSSFTTKRNVNREKKRKGDKTEKKNWGWRTYEIYVPKS